VLERIRFSGRICIPSILTFMAATRLRELDALRGLMLALMTVTHLPTRLSSPLGQPFGYVSAAEGFVLLSAYMAGMVYGRTAQAKGIETMATAFWWRALKVYGCHLAILLFLFTVIAAVGPKVDQPVVRYLMDYYLAEPARAFVAGAALLYKPPLLDILPMYVLFMLASPLLMAQGLRRGWRGLMMFSVGLWLLSQLGLGQWLYDITLGAAGAHLPFNETGAFATFAWQFLWVLGLWMGASRSEAEVPAFAFPRWAVAVAAVFAMSTFFWRHWFGQAPFEPGVTANIVFDKWQLAPLRLINVFALMILVIRFGPALVAWKPRWPFLETLGAASLPVFCAHLVVVLMSLALWGDQPKARQWWGDGLLLVGCFALLFGVARLTSWLGHQSALVAEGRNQRKANAARANQPLNAKAPIRMTAAIQGLPEANDAEAASLSPK
jgi:hypothetical protein